MKHFITILILLSLYISSHAREVDHWETIIQVGDTCSYLVPSSDIGSAWITSDFIDLTWTLGESGFGFGDNDDRTVIPKGASSVYLRFHFTVENKSDFEELILDMDYDDGFIAYLNGVEVARDNVNDPITWNMSLKGLHEAGMYSGGLPERFDISKHIASVLQNGANVLAVEVHNESSSSSDMSSNVFLHVGLSTKETRYQKTPDWYKVPVVFNGYNLPLMIINSNDQKIERDRIVADMGLINNEEGKLNNEGDAWNAYSGKISIKRRGESSYGFPKRQYSIELQNEDGSNNNVSLLGLPEENDFVLYGPYSDKTMIKNVLTYELYRRTGRWAPRTKFIEIILDGKYEGVYVLIEKLKRDDNRINIDKLTEEDITGGYILRRDKTDDSEPNEWWESPVKQPYNKTMWYEYYDPKRKDLSDAQAKYIKDWMKNFDEVMSSKQFADPETGYKSYIKVKSFIDMMFINEITKGIDNYNFSNYFYKESDVDGGQLVAGAPWDYNLGYGNVNYGFDWNAPETYGWCYTQGGRIYWFKRLMEDEVYQNKVNCRWTKFRDDIFSDESVLGIIDSCVTVLGDAVERNFSKYPTLGTYVWPAKEPFPDTYEGEIENLKTWTIEHLHWMDKEWYGNCVEVEDEDDKSAIESLAYHSVKLYPNPSDFSRIKVELNEHFDHKDLTVEILDLRGSLVVPRLKQINSTRGFYLPNYSHLPKGMYLVKITYGNQIVGMKKMVKSI